jgi:HEAT repeat protein
MPGGDDDAIARRLEGSLTGETQKDTSILRAIGKRGGPEAARAIVEYLQRVKNPNDVQMHVLQSLDVSTDKVAAEIVAAALKTEGSPKVQRALIAMAMRPGATAMTAPLMGLDRDGVSDDVRAMALRALGRIADPKAAAYLLKKAEEPGVFGERALSAVALMNSSDPAVGELLAQALADAHRNPRPERTKASLLEALGTARHAPSMPVIARSLDDRDAAVQIAAVRAMGRLGSKATAYVPQLVRLFDGGDPKRQQGIAVSLANIGGKEAVAEMRRLLKVEDLDASVRRTLQVGLRNAETKLASAPK